MLSRITTAVPAEVLNITGLSDEVKKVIMLLFFVAAGYVIYRGHKGKLGESLSVFAIGLIALAIVALGLLVGTEAGNKLGSNLLSAVFKL